LTAHASNETALKIQHLCLPCPWSSRAQTIGDMVLCYAGAHGRTIIFTETKKEANELALDEGIKVECAVLHGDIAQAQRETTFQAFRDGKFRCLVATDVAARGLDIPEIDLVIMCHPTKDPDTYVHRAGRTGRAGRSGVAVTFFTPRELPGLRLIERRIKTQMTQVSAPQPAEIVKANARDLRQSVGEVHEEVLPLFEHIAQEMIADMGAVKALCAAMAVACGHTKPLPAKSLLTSLEGFKTFVVALEEGQEPLQETRQLFPILRKVLPQHAVSSVRGLRLFKPANRAFGCAFDVPVDKVQVCGRSMCVCVGNAFMVSTPRQSALMPPRRRSSLPSDSIRGNDV
jgi:ATP-dependent RNA helicase DDX21